MQIQINVHDREELIKYRDNSDLYPHLLARVSGYLYSILFNTTIVISSSRV